MKSLGAAASLLFVLGGSIAGAQPPASGIAAKGEPVAITVQLDQSLGAYTPIYAWFGMDEVNYGTTPNGRKLLGELHDLSPVPVYIRAHHLFTSGDGKPDLKWSSTNVYTEDAAGNPVYDFKILDGIFDAYKEAGVRPLVEFGFTPKDLASETGEYRIPYPGKVLASSVHSPPKDYLKWQNLVRAVVVHFVERYGRETVLQWYFEVWNEPDFDFWHGTPEEYWKLYDHAAEGLKSVLPGARIGGPATTGPSSEKARGYLESFLDHVMNGKSAATGGPVPLDYISFHAKGIPQFKDGVLKMGIQREIADVDRGFALISKFPRLKKLPIILTEIDPEPCAACSAKVNPANAYRNGPLFAANTATTFKSLFELQDRYKVNLKGMLSWTFMVDGKPYFEGYRSLATNGIDKPILNFFRMAGLMRGARVATKSTSDVTVDRIIAGGVRGEADVDALATVAEREAAVLLWNYHDDATRVVAAPVEITLNALPRGVRRVLVTHYRIDESHSNAFTIWKGMGSPQNPTPEQYALLQERGGLEQLGSPSWMDVADRTLSLKTTMPGQSVSLFRIAW